MSNGSSSGGFSEVPEAGQRERNWEILRCGATEALKFVILSDQVTGHSLHFYGGRSKPCSRPGCCEGCENGNMARWYGYLGAHAVRGHDLAVVEITAGVAERFQEARRKFGTLRGLRCRLERRGKRREGKLIATFLPANVALDELPVSINVLRMMCRVWEIPEQLSVPRELLSQALNLGNKREGGAK